MCLDRLSEEMVDVIDDWNKVIKIIIYFPLMILLFLTRILNAFQSNHLLVYTRYEVMKLSSSDITRYCTLASHYDSQILT